MARQLAKGEKEQAKVKEAKTNASPSIKLTPWDLGHYEKSLNKRRRLSLANYYPRVCLDCV